MNYYPVTDGQKVMHEPTMQYAQVDSKMTNIGEQGHDLQYRHAVIPLLDSDITLWKDTSVLEYHSSSQPILPL